MIKILGIDVGTQSLGWALISANKDNDFNAIIDSGVVIFPKGNNEDKQGKEFSRSQARTTFRGTRRLRQRRKLIKYRIVNFFKQYNVDIENEIFFENKTNQSSDPMRLYSLRNQALYEKLTLHEIAQLLVFFNNKRGFKSNRKNQEKDEDKGKVKESIKSLYEKLAIEHSETLGQYYYNLIQAHRRGERLQERILGNYTARQMYVDEVEKIWQKQSEFYPEILNEEHYNSLIKKGIFYQRNLKSQKHLISKCTFEPEKRVAPKSHPIFQSYRLLTNLHNIKINYADGNLRTLSENEVIDIFNAIKYLAVINEKSNYDVAKTRSAIKKQVSSILKLGKKDKLTDIELIPLTTEIRIKQALGETFFNTLNEENLLNLHHCLHFFEDDEKLKFWIKNKYHVNDEQAENFANIVLEQDYASISVKACNKLLPYLAQGFSLTNAKAQVYMDGEKNKSKRGENPNKHYQEWLNDNPIKKDKISYYNFNELRNPVVQKSLSECIGVVNAITAKYDKPDLIRVELARDLKKPRSERDEIKQKQSFTEEKREQLALFLNNKKIFQKQVSKFDSIIDKYLLWLELGNDDSKLNEQIEEVKKVKKLKKPKDLLSKFSYWLECNRQCPYTGDIISLSDLFSGKYEIEHILPYSRSLDNSQSNKTLSQRAFNQQKGNQTPMEYFETQGKQALEQFKKRIAHFNESKREKFLCTDNLNDDFTNNQIADTAYTARLLKNKLKEILPQNQIQITKGGITSLLRKFWKLNHLLHIDLSISNEKLLQTLKNRKDHRHHAIDAIVIACTSRQIINIVNKHTHFRDNTDIVFKNDKNNKAGLHIENSILKAPWFGFVEDVHESINNILVNYRFRKRLVQQKTNRIKTKEKGKFIEQKAIGVRDVMHAETVMGKMLTCDENQYVKTKPINTFTEAKHLESIVDKPLRDFLQQLVIIHGIGILKSNSIQWPENHTGRILRNVKIFEKSNSMIEIRKGAFVEPDNNFCIAIYEGETETMKKGVSTITTKRDYEVVSFYKAVQKKLNGELLFPKSKNGLALKMSLKQGDMVVMYKTSPDEIDWDKKKNIFDSTYKLVKMNQTNGQIIFSKHFLANTNADKDANPVILRPNYNTLNCIKIKLNRLGEIYWRSDIGYLDKK